MKKFTDSERRLLIWKINQLRKEGNEWIDLPVILGHPLKTLQNVYYKQRERDKKAAMKSKQAPTEEQITKIVADRFGELGALDPEKPEKIKRSAAVKKIYIVEPESMQYIALEITDQGNDLENMRAALDKIKYCEFKEFADVTPGLNNQ